MFFSMQQETHMGLDNLLDDHDNSSRYIVMSDKWKALHQCTILKTQVHQKDPQIILNSKGHRFLMLLISKVMWCICDFSHLQQPCISKTADRRAKQANTPVHLMTNRFRVMEHSEKNIPNNPQMTLDTNMSQVSQSYKYQGAKLLSV